MRQNSYLGAASALSSAWDAHADQFIAAPQQQRLILTLCAKSTGLFYWGLSAPLGVCMCERGKCVGVLEFNGAL
jgi:hypothetical protein